MKIYWANSFFSEADREFNTRYVRLLRKRGYTVFAPQETSYNKVNSPDAMAIFDGDTIAVRNSDILVACIDHETIDSGVACEVGFAHAIGVPVVGLLTDIRRLRTGTGKIYKNQFVVGCILSRGEIVNSEKTLLSAIEERTKDTYDKR